jgi:two-component system chemotaxis response regulator CheY
MKKKILIVEDDMGVGLLLEKILAKKYSVYWAEDGLAAIRWLRHDLPDLIITDIRMPHLDGLQLIRTLNKSGLYRDIPIIVLTGDTTASDLSNLHDFVFDCFQKPFNPTMLLQSVDKVFAISLNNNSGR